MSVQALVLVLGQAQMLPAGQQFALVVELVAAYYLHPTLQPQQRDPYLSDFCCHLAEQQQTVGPGYPCRCCRH
jgi:hypothetical protein